MSPSSSKLVTIAIVVLLVQVPLCYPFIIPPTHSRQSNGLKNHHHHHHHHHHEKSSDVNIDTDIGIETLSKVMQISSGHFKSQALYSFVALGIPNILGDDMMTIHEISKELGKAKANDDSKSKPINQDALYRMMRLLTSLDVVNEAYVEMPINDKNGGVGAGAMEPLKLSFQLTHFGKCLQNDEDLASCILHWLERPLWNAWSYLPEYILGEEADPFEQANGVSSDFYYNMEDNPRSLKYANTFVRLVSDAEINSIVKSFDWSSLRNKTIVDIGGFNGKVMGAISSYYAYSNLTLKCLDLPHVIRSIDKSTTPQGVELIEGDVLEPSTIPSCDVIFMKHFLDRCMWKDEETVKILKSCADVIPNDGLIILGDAVIPSIDTVHESQCDDDMLLSLDAFYMLVGRDRQRTVREWKFLAQRASLKVARIIPGFPSCYLLVLCKKS